VPWLAGAAGMLALRSLALPMPGHPKYVVGPARRPVRQDSAVASGHGRGRITQVSKIVSSELARSGECRGLANPADWQRIERQRSTRTARR
jgi:hypothetical protein